MAYLPFPSGTLLTFAGSTAPDGWLLCDGSAVSRTTYARLFAAISTTYGNGDGALTFNIPDLRGVYPRGAGTNGTANYGGVTGHTPAAGALATKGGQKTAKNGLANSGSNTVSGTAAGQTLASNIALSVSGNRSQFDRTSTGMSANASHGHSIGNVRRSGLNYAAGAYGPCWEDAGSGALTSAASVNTDHSHSISYDSTFNATGSVSSVSLNSSALTATAAAPTISGDTETTPAFLAVNYIIKL